MLNGTPLNENDFGTHTLGQRIPLSNVDRIEVVMGPGTVLHGNYAALGLVNIITRTADEAAGTQALVRTGITREGVTRTNAAVSGAHRLNRDQEISYLLSNVTGRTSNAQGLLPDGSPISFQDSTNMESFAFQFNYRWKQFKAFMAYHEESADVSDGRYRVLFRDALFGMEYRTSLAKNVEMTARLSQSSQTPWYYLNTDDPDRLASNTENQRTHGSMLLAYKPSGWLSARVGLQGFHQRSRFMVRSSEAVFTLSGTPTLFMNDAAVFAEADMHGTWGNLTAGYRYEYNDLMGPFGAPRLAYTIARGRLHGKLLWSQVFRMPTVMNVNYGPVDGTVIAEQVTTAQAEVGVKLGTTGQVTLNLHRTRIDDPIVYVYDAVTLDNYLNRTMAGTQGGDLRYSLDQERWTLLAGVGMHQTIAGADIPESMLPEGTSMGYQGLPFARAVTALSWDASDRFTLRSLGQWQAPTWSYQYRTAGSDTKELMQWPSELLLNAGITVRPSGRDRLSIDLGCNNILDQERLVLSPLNNALIPLRLNGREWTLAVIFKFVQ